MLPNFIKLTEDVHSQLALSDEADKIFDTVIKSIIKVVKNPEKFNEVFKYGKDLTNKYGLLVDPTLYKDINPINTKKLKIYLAKRDNFDIGTNAIYAHNFDKSGAHHNIVLYVISKEAKTEEDIIKSLSNILKSSAKQIGRAHV